MSWSLKVATVRGVPIYLHVTFLLLIAFILVGDFAQNRQLAHALASVLFAAAVFASIVLHELGHALTAKRFGIRTRDITLLPIGGLSRMERMPDVPSQEFWVAMAGPAVNAALAVIAYALSLLVTHAAPSLRLVPGRGDILGSFASVNAVLAVFNLIPAFPMDGGRALRALLAERMDYARATHVAARLGEGLALVFGCVGLFFDPLLVFIALFVWMGASSESAAVDARIALTGVPVARAMRTDFRTLEASQPLQEAVDLMLAESQRDFPVITGGQLVGLLTHRELLGALAGGRIETGRVGETMSRTVATADPHEMLDAAFQRMKGHGDDALPVVRGRQVVGILTPENVAEFMMFRDVAGAGHGRRRVR